MRLGIISDTHDQLEITRKALNLLWTAGVDALVHCGDITGASIIKLCSNRPCWFVFGNHDADNVPELQTAAEQHGVTCLGWAGVIELEAKLIGVSHGHMTYDIRQIMAKRPHYLLTGHSHIPNDSKVGLTRRINPGALFEADQLTVAILDLHFDDLQWLTLDAT